MNKNENDLIKSNDPRSATAEGWRDRCMAAAKRLVEAAGVTYRSCSLHRLVRRFAEGSEKSSKHLLYSTIEDGDNSTLTFLNENRWESMQRTYNKEEMKALVRGIDATLRKMHDISYS